MPQTVEALYHDGVVELLQRPVGILRSKALVIFLETKKAEKRHAVDLAKVSKKKSTVDKWIGVEGTELGDWKAERIHKGNSNDLISKTD